MTMQMSCAADASPSAGYQSVELFPGVDTEHLDWDSPPTLETTLPGDPSKLPAIHTAVYDPTSTLEAIEAMVTSDPLCLNAVDPNTGYSPLHAAARHAHTGLIKMLVNHGAVVEAGAANGETPLIVACQVGNLYSVHTLCGSGADPRAVDTTGQTTLHHAAKCGAVHIIHYLTVSQGLDLRMTDKEGNTPLHCAVYNLKMDTINYLIKHKRSDVAAANNMGATPLHLAAKHGNVEVSWLLLCASKRKDLFTLKDVNRRTPQDIAKMGHTNSHDILAKRFATWSTNPDYMRFYPWFFWLLFALLGGISLLLCMWVFSSLAQPVGFVVAVLIAVPGFFLPISLHRIPHPSGWQNPHLIGALVAGVSVTTLSYFIKIFSVLWLDNTISFLLLAVNSLYALYLFFMFKNVDPGFDKTGKISSDGTPLTILDVAKQADRSESSLKEDGGQGSTGGDVLFCTRCEIVIPEYTKHCKLCDACCRGFDHHCMWLTKCIGYNNHRMFVIFLLCLALDSSFFIWHALHLMAKVGKSWNVWHMLGVGFSTEPAVLFMMLLNIVAAGFSYINLVVQLLHISRMETTYFDMTGLEAYNRKRQRPALSVCTRVKVVLIFFTNYPLWFSRRPISSTTYQKFSA